MSDDLDPITLFEDLLSDISAVRDEHGHMTLDLNTDPYGHGLHGYAADALRPDGAPDVVRLPPANSRLGAAIERRSLAGFLQGGP